MSSNPFHNASFIQIRLQRDGDESHDDRIAIKQKDDSLYQLFFRDGNSKSTPKTYCVPLTGEELDTYFTCLFTLLVRDADPFEYIQFTIPCFPSVLYSIQDLRQGKIREALATVLPLLTSVWRI